MTTATAIEVSARVEAWHSRSVEEVLAQLGSAATGLSPAEAAKRLATDGPNELKEGKTHQPVVDFLLASSRASSPGFASSQE